MTGVPRGRSARRFIRALESDGFALQRVRGSHRIYRHADERRVVVAYHALNDTFPIGTLTGDDCGRGVAGRRFVEIWPEGIVGAGDG